MLLLQICHPFKSLIKTLSALQHALIASRVSVYSFGNGCDGTSYGTRQLKLMLLCPGWWPWTTKRDTFLQFLCQKQQLRPHCKLMIGWMRLPISCDSLPNAIKPMQVQCFLSHCERFLCPRLCLLHACLPAVVHLSLATSFFAEAWHFCCNPLRLSRPFTALASGRNFCMGECC